jgi:uncharacterized protein (TIGR02145 family)
VDISNLSCWNNAPQVGTRRWRGYSLSGNLCAQATAFQSSASSEITWLISPPVNYSDGMTLSFRSQRGFGVSGHDPFAVLISTNYNVDNLTTANWVNAPCNYATPSTADQVWVNSGLVDLSALLPPGYSGSFVIGFRYTGSGPNGQTTDFRVDDVLITGGLAAMLTTLPMSNITASSAVSGGNITNGGGTPVTQRGVCWSTSPNPTTANNTTSDGSGLGSYTSNLAGLVVGATYYVRAYATNSAGTAYGNQVQFTAAGDYLNPNLTYGSVTDQNGNTYATIVIGTQEWMAENLRTTTYANGDPIPNVTDSTEWTQLTTGAWAHYDNNSSYNYPYGKLYNGYAVADPRNVCPTNWHVPTDAEWSALVNYLDPANGSNGEYSTTAGGMMKSTGTQYWPAPNTGATNESGFSGLPGGGRYNLGGPFNALGYGGGWWSASESGAGYAWYRFLYYNNADVDRNNNPKRNGFSVRCLRD